MKLSYKGYCRMTRGSGAPFEQKEGAFALENGENIVLPWQDAHLEVLDVFDEGARLCVGIGENISEVFLPYHETKAIALERAALRLEIELVVEP